MKRLLVISTFLLLGACANPHLDQEPLPPTPTTSVSTVPSTPNEPAVKEPERQVDSKPSVPRRLYGWRLGDASVVPLQLDGNTLVPPSDPKVLGWWGSKAGAKKGTTLLVGHTVHTGGGYLDDLEKVPVGSSVTLSGHQYHVVSNRVISKLKLAQIAPKLFSQNGQSRLVVVTCENYDPATGHYDSNVVMVAK